MRTILTRVALFGVFGLLALNGCGGSNGTSLPFGGAPNGSGGGSINSTNGNGPAPPLGLPTIIIDNGTVPPKYAAFGPNTSPITDVQSPLNSETPPPTPAPPATPPPTPTPDPGSHLITFAGNGAFNIIEMKYGGTVPASSLVYQFGIPGNGTFYNYGRLSLDLLYVPGATSPGTLTTPFIEIGGGSGTSAYDVRVNCATSGTLNATTFTTYVCLLPAYSAASGVYTTTYSSTTKAYTESGPTALNGSTVTPSATGLF